MRLLARALLVWLCFGFVAVAVGGLRERFLVPALGELAAHQLGTLVVCLLIAVIIVRAIGWLRPTRGEAWAVGALWVAATVAFEIGVFHYWVGVPWERLLADYDLFAGRLWVLVLVVELVAPMLASRRLKAREG